MLIGVARFLAAHAPTVRPSGQTYDMAVRLHPREKNEIDDQGFEDSRPHTNSATQRIYQGEIIFSDELLSTELI